MANKSEIILIWITCIKDRKKESTYANSNENNIVTIDLHLPVTVTWLIIKQYIEFAFVLTENSKKHKKLYV